MMVRDSRLSLLLLSAGAALLLWTFVYRNGYTKSSSGDGEPSSSQSVMKLEKDLVGFPNKPEEGLPQTISSITAKLEKSQSRASSDEIPMISTADTKLVLKGSSAAALLFGLDMDDKNLIAAIKNAFLPPAAKDAPYYLEVPEQVYFSQFGQDKLVAKMLKHKTDGFFFEAGALTGERLSNTLYLERVLGWTGVLVEPTPISFRVLQGKNRRAYALQAGLAPNTTSSKLTLDIGTDSPYLAKLANELGTKRSKNVVEVTCFPLFSILQAVGNPVVDYLSLDVEGHEMKILKSIPWDRIKIRVIGIEINNLPEGRAAVKKYMEQQGFVFYKLQTIDYFFYHPDYKSDLNL